MLLNPSYDYYSNYLDLFLFFSLVLLCTLYIQPIIWPSLLRSKYVKSTTSILNCYSSTHSLILLTAFGWQPNVRDTQIKRFGRQTSVLRQMPFLGNFSHLDSIRTGVVALPETGDRPTRTPPAQDHHAKRRRATPSEWWKVEQAPPY